MPNTTGTGAPQQLQPLTHPPSSTGAPLERDGGAVVVSFEDAGVGTDPSTPADGDGYWYSYGEKRRPGGGSG